MCAPIGWRYTVQLLAVRWMTISHLIYELDGLGLVCALTCNNVSTLQQLRKMSRRRLEGSTAVCMCG